MPTGGGPRTQITGMPGHNQVDISPDETMLADVRSYSNKPPELYLIPNQPMDEKASRVAQAGDDFADSGVLHSSIGSIRGW